MSLDILRRVAFDGPLNRFVTEPPDMLARAGVMTGLHLRFDANFLRPSLAWRHRLPYWHYDILLHERRALLEQAVGLTPGTERWDWLHHWYEYYGRRLGYPKGGRPVIILVDVNPDLDAALFRELPSAFDGYPIRYRRSGDAVAHLASGTKIGTANANFGSFGGMLQDIGTNELYGVTCQHVVGNPNSAVRDLVGNTVIGQVSASVIPTPHAGACNRRAHAGADIDAALIKLNAALPTSGGQGGFKSIIDVDQDDFVEFHGASSGVVRARITAATIWKAVDVQGTRRCFADVFSIGHVGRQYIVNDVSQPGDSGAWIYEAVDPPASSQWLGMLIAGDRQQNQSIACYAEHILTWAQSVNGNLVPA